MPGRQRSTRSAASAKEAEPKPPRAQNKRAPRKKEPDEKLRNQAPGPSSRTRRAKPQDARSDRTADDGAGVLEQPVVAEVADNSASSGGAPAEANSPAPAPFVRLSYAELYDMMERRGHLHDHTRRVERLVDQEMEERTSVLVQQYIRNHGCNNINYEQLRREVMEPVVNAISDSLRETMFEETRQHIIRIIGNDPESMERFLQGNLP
ncbi:hypothetical protein QR680_000284 [Steinernema hermaphroditum]|uniref:Uncharacterized protein n=1 Tax=Steinernema hermaphroditum TaxID=289476 RepID=A0AA39LE11_9BILA|nr:hypothetical protein QR680_000284 [Steinernema hermaphroditum]